MIKVLKDKEINLRTRPEPHNTQYLEAMAGYRFVRERVKGLNVLDAGCAYGYGTDLLGGSAAAVTGVDFSPETILWARKNYRRKNINFIITDLEKTSFAAGCFDAVCLFEVLHLVKDYRKVLGELSRVIKKGGELFASTRNWKEAQKVDADAAHLHCFTQDQWRGILSEYGFATEETFGISRPEQVYRLESKLESIRKFDFLGIRRIIPRSAVSFGVYLISKIKGIIPPQEMKCESFEISRVTAATSPGVLFLCRKN
ncbi:MAG: class I SAM-dependent methyltransferase [Candidatus Omnitrophota bacterium]|nr:class I SAM-dependent methyltransferase [Candidatus Omnitrophota bacterium]